mgnify:FL=1
MRYTNDIIKKKSEKIDKRKKLIKLIIYIMIIPIIFYNISLIFFSIINKSETPNFFGIKTFVIISGSMEPNLKISDIVIIKKCEQNELKENDIISFRSGQSVITHRINQIIETENGVEYITKGDNNNTKDNGTVKFDDIEGKYIGKIEYLGKVVLYLKNKTVIISIIIIFYLIYAHEMKTNEKLQLRREKREKFEKKRG